MSAKGEMPKTYDFSTTEGRLYKWWEESGWFKPEVAGPDAEPFVISIPPPNVTGALHQGHALFVALEDLMIRHARMSGKAALWVPGSDHAGIATQLQVERLLESEGTSREEVGREEFLRRTWEWKEKYGGRITEQLRRLGASCDWERERFTLDEGLSRAVREAFVRWYEQGLIYRGTYLINWSPNLQTAVSDLEVEHTEQQGTLYTFKYPIAGSDAFIPVATTRPETILADTAVAVHPEDDRYTRFVGKTALVPMLDREIPVIADSYVDMEFGTGALKVTPGHDTNDYEIRQRHDLNLVNFLNKDATLNEHAGPYAGLDRYEAREKLWADMEKAGLTLKTEPYTHTVPISQRGGEQIEPLISTQWFVQTREIADGALKAVSDGHIKIVPERFEKIYNNWLENIRDWCISRQLWWGHRIPAWHCDDCNHITVARQDPDKCEQCGSANIRQDPDVLDTWFSSGLWPFSTLGWPDQTPDLERYYPTSVMETGYDILFFWVARMIMMGLSFTEEAPFHTVYMHGLVRDAQGRKMSKTTGNVIDPIEVMDKFGTDALRFTLLTGGTPGNDMNLAIDHIQGNRNFANKIWNAARFLTANLDGETPTGPPPRDGLSIPNRWILSRLQRLVERVNRLFDTYQYGEAGRQVYEFLWGEYADWYIEISKVALNGEDAKARSLTRHVLTHVLDQCLRMLHPFVPFVTEEIWQHIPHEGETLMLAAWPESNPANVDDEAETAQEQVMAIISGIRRLRADLKVEPKKRIEDVTIEAPESYQALESQKQSLARLAGLNVDTTTVVQKIEAPPAGDTTSIVVGDATAFLPLVGLFDREKEVERKQIELADIEARIAKSEKLLGSDFANKAPDEVVQRERDKLAALQTERETLNELLAGLGA
jgi:valyl-tRNA synthetase